MVFGERKNAVSAVGKNRQLHTERRYKNTSMKSLSLYFVDIYTFWAGPAGPFLTKEKGENEEKKISTAAQKPKTHGASLTVECGGGMCTSVEPYRPPVTLQRRQPSGYIYTLPA